MGRFSPLHRRMRMSGGNALFSRFLDTTEVRDLSPNFPHAGII
jgi:hypothetical protein